MADTQIQLRRNTAAVLAGKTPAEGEPNWVTDEKVPLFGDGVRTGGFKGLTFDTWQRQKYIYAVAAGTADALTLTLSPQLIARVGGTSVVFKAAANNTDVATLNVDATGAGTLKKLAGGALADLEADDIVENGVYRATWNGSFWILEGGVGGGGGGGWQAIETITPAAVSSADMEIGFDGSYKALRLSFDLEFTTGGGNRFELRFKIGGTYQASGYAAGLAYSTAGAWVWDTKTSGLDLGRTSASGRRYSGFVEYVGDPSANRYHNATYRIAGANTTSPYQGAFGGGGYNTAGVMSGWRLYIATSTFTGTATLEGLPA